MEKQNLKNEAHKLRNNGKTYKGIVSMLNVSLLSSSKMCTYIHEKTSKMRHKVKVIKKIKTKTSHV